MSGRRHVQKRKQIVHVRCPHRSHILPTDHEALSHRSHDHRRRRKHQLRRKCLYHPRQVARKQFLKSLNRLSHHRESIAITITTAAPAVALKRAAAEKAKSRLPELHHPIPASTSRSLVHLVRMRTARKPPHRAEEKANQSEKPLNAEDDEMPLPRNPLPENQLHRAKESREDEPRAGRVRDTKRTEVSERGRVDRLLPAGQRRRHSLPQLRSQRDCWALFSGLGEESFGLPLWVVFPNV
jgi:hypothetical protein